MRYKKLSFLFLLKREMAENTVINYVNEYWKDYVINREDIGKTGKDFPALPSNYIVVVNNIFQSKDKPITTYIKKSNNSIKRYLMTHNNGFYELFTPLTNHYLTFDIDQKMTKKIDGKEVENTPNKELIKSYFEAFDALAEELGVNYKFAGYSNTFETVDEFKNDNNVIYFRKIENAGKWFSAHVIFNFPANVEQISRLLSPLATKWIYNDQVIDYDHSIYSFNKLLRAGFANKCQGKDYNETMAPIPDNELVNFIEQTHKNAVSDEVFDKLRKFFIHKEEPRNVKPKDDKPKDDKDEEPDEETEEYVKDAFQIVVPIEVVRDLLINHYPVGDYSETLYVKEGSVYFKALCGLLSSCPYKLNEIKNVVHEWYNTVSHNHPDATNKLVDEKYNLDYMSNKYFHALMKPFKAPPFKDYVIEHIDEEQKEQYNEYCKVLKHKTNKSLSRKKREIKADMEDLENDIRIEYEQEYKEVNRIYNKYKTIFDTYTLACNNGRLSAYRYNVFLDTESKRIYSISETGALHQQTKDSMSNYYGKQFSVDYLIKINAEDLIDMNISHKLRTTGRYSTNEDVQGAYRFLDIFKKSFVNEIDYKEAREDVIPFIRNVETLNMWNKDFFINITKKIN